MPGAEDERNAKLRKRLAADHDLEHGRHIRWLQTPSAVAQQPQFAGLSVPLGRWGSAWQWVLNRQGVGGIEQQQKPQATTGIRAPASA
jgi:hypothetical protein